MFVKGICFIYPNKYHKYNVKYLSIQNILLQNTIGSLLSDTICMLCACGVLSDDYVVLCLVIAPGKAVIVIVSNTMQDICLWSFHSSHHEISCNMSNLRLIAALDIYVNIYFTTFEYKLCIIYFQTHMKDQYFEHFLRNFPLTNSTRPNWLSFNVGSANVLVPSGTGPLP